MHIEKKKLVHSFYNEMWNLWNENIAQEILAIDVSFRGSLGDEKKGRDGFIDYMRYVKKTFPDFYNELEYVVSDESKTIAKLTFSGTHEGKIFGIDPTYRKISYSGMACFDFNDQEKIKSIWVLGDVYGLVEQLRS